MEGRFARGVRYGVEVALSRFVDVLAGEPPEPGPARHLRTTRCGRVPRRPLAHRAARRLPRRRARWRGGASSTSARGRASRPTSSTTSARRSSPTSTRSRPSRSRASRRRSRRRPGRRSAAGATLLRLLTQEPPAAEETVRAAALTAGWTLPRVVAAVVAAESRRGHRRDRGAARAPDRHRRARAPPSTRWRSSCSRDPEGPGRRRSLETALAADRAALGPAGAVAGVRDAASAERERAYRAVGSGSALAIRPVRDRRRRAPPGAAAGGRTGAGGRPRAHPPGALWTRSPPAPGNGSRPRCARGWTAPGRCRRWPPRSTSIRRPSATGSSSCASCSGRAWRIPRPVSSSRSRCARPTASPPPHSLHLAPCAFSSPGPRACSAPMSSRPPPPDTTSSPSRAPSSTSRTTTLCAPPCATPRPDAIINCAAWTDVDRAEADEAAATLINGDGAGHLAAAASEVGAHIVHVSTDYVFPGDATSPLPGERGDRPDRRVRALQARGRDSPSRRSPITRSSARRGCSGRTARTSSTRCCGSAPSATSSRWSTTSSAARPTRATSPPRWCGSPSTRTHGVLHVAGGGQCTWWDLAVATFEAAGLSVRVNRGSSADLGRPGPAPRLLRPRLDPLRRARAAVVAGGPHAHLTLREVLAS